MSIWIECQGCHRTFEAGRINKVWCAECKDSRRKEYQARYDTGRKEPCPRCGTPKGFRALLCRSCDNKDRAVRHLGENNPNWRQGRTSDKLGYVYVRIRPGAHRAGQHAYRAEHRVVWEAAHGPIPKGWIIHHLNGIKGDNRIENLAAMPRSEHHIRHAEPYERRIKELEARLRA
ncbi:hypothetical protein LCGC14_1146770 [marine sediment metagenome]|uniref:HNH nuclease domain-containing protein n=1 Tax=marine sediment metagenome TaxID=412755 RepID=A0A0F9M1I9_9ZZZZ